MSAVLLNVNGIEVIYNHVILVLKGVSLQVPEGGVVALLGGNGAGKTTTLRAVSNLLAGERGEVTKGSIELRGERIEALSTADMVQRGVVQVMEGRHCFAHLTIEENLLTGAYTRRDGKAAVAQTLEKFTGFWFSGGDQSRLSTLLVGTRALQAIEARYQAGAVVGGTSAGASVMSRLMLTGKWRTPRNSDEEEQVNIARGMKELAPGFGFFKGAIVDQHFMHRARYNRLISAVLDHPQLIGVGIDEETALLVRADGQWEVLGNYYVKIFDARRAQIVDDRGPMAKAADIRMHVLPEGGLFDPRRRRVEFQEVNIP